MAGLWILGVSGKILISNFGFSRMKLSSPVQTWSVSFTLTYGSTSCQAFKEGVQNQKYFCLKFNIPKYIKSLCSKEIIEFWELVLWGGVKKYQNLNFKMNFPRQKSRETLWVFFIEGYKFRSTFIDFFDNIKFKSLYFLD